MMSYTLPGIYLNFDVETDLYARRLFFENDEIIMSGGRGCLMDLRSQLKFQTKNLVELSKKNYLFRTRLINIDAYSFDEFVYCYV